MALISAVRATPIAFGPQAVGPAAAALARAPAVCVAAGVAAATTTVIAAAAAMTPQARMVEVRVANVTA